MDADITNEVMTQKKDCRLTNFGFFIYNTVIYFFCIYR